MTNEKFYSIEKVFSPRSEYNGKWIIKSFSVGYLGFHENVNIVFVAETRKAVREYAKKNDLPIRYIDSGRRPAGAKW